MKRVWISVKAPKSDLLEKVEVAEKAVQNLYAVLADWKQTESGLSHRLATEGNETEYENTKYIYLTKEIGEDAIKEPLEEINKLIEPLKEAVKKLDQAIITEITKEKPKA